MPNTYYNRKKSQCQQLFWIILRKRKKEMHQNKHNKNILERRDMLRPLEELEEYILQPIIECISSIARRMPLKKERNASKQVQH
jgi:hypothetical protein